MKKLKVFTNKNPWGMKTHGKHVSFRMHTTQPKGTSPCKQAYTKKHQQEVKENNPCSFLTKKEQLRTHIREPSLWEWTKGCPINFLPPSAWREQCPRAVILAEVKKMKRLHDLPQNCTSSRREAETKLSKFQQIDAINIKNDQDVIHVPSPWILKGKNLEHMVWMV